MENQNLEQYLFELEKHLKDLPPSKRSKIVADNHQHILEAREKYPEKSMSEILRDLGSPQKVANHYRLDLGLKTFRPKKHPFLKWFSITVLGSIAIFFAFITVLVWKFTPLAKFDEEEQRVILLGGLIDINGNSGKIKIFDQYQFVENRFTNQFDGSFELTPDMNEILVNFDTGMFTFTTTTSKRASWNCKLQMPPEKDIVSILPHALEINLEAYGGGSCDIEVPVDATLTVVGKDGQINIHEAEFDVMTEFTNGNINWMPNPEVEYSYDIRLQKGLSDSFTSSTLPNAYEVKFYLENGNIRKSRGP
ncbi:MAG: hypothetical protein CME67_02065 [Halobacteriovoraceae bacterium]|nr:hypothetical protein [Peredibacter sp.]MBI99989.1 hypothetical protein [Halobacteriovoraceae bacterium]|tara:strand:- start:2377 stop:3297 length:921 start_codon:yes stop_codon:yes gene_type:complete